MTVYAWTDTAAIYRSMLEERYDLDLNGKIRVCVLICLFAQRRGFLKNVHFVLCRLTEREKRHSF